MGRSIRIYLADGTAGGVRHAEIANWTGQALAIPRNKVFDLKSWPEVGRQGVYFLFGPDERDQRDAVYIGEAEIVGERIAQHLKTKDFWAECVVFSSKDENLTKSHIKYLESRLVAEAAQAGRYAVLNAASPQEAALPRPDRDAMDEFAENIRILLGVLGHRVLDPAISRETTAVLQSQKVAPETAAIASPGSADMQIYTLAVGSLRARSVRDADGLVVLAESDAAKNELPSLSTSYQLVRRRLIGEGVLVDSGEVLRFTRNVSFPSASQAAAVIVGYSINGRSTWKAPDGRSLRDVEEAEAEAVGGQLVAEPAVPESVSPSLRETP